MGMNLSDLALAIMVLGIVVSIGGVIMTNYKTSQVTNLPVLSDSDLSINVTTTGVTLEKVWVKDITSCTLVNGTSVGSSNYNLAVSPDFGTGVLSATTGSGFKNMNWNCTYGYYDTTDVRYDLPSDAAVGLAEYGNWFKILVIVGVAAVVLGLIFMAFGKSSSSSSQASVY